MRGCVPIAALLFALLATAPRLTGQGISLPELEKLALESHPSVLQGQASVRSAEGRLKQSGLYPNPSVGYNGEQIRGGQQGGGEQGFFVKQDIVLGGKLGAARQEAGRARELAGIGAEARKLRVLNQVRVLFYQGLAAQRLVELRRSLSGISKDFAQTTAQLGNIGQADRPDILQAEVETGQADLAVLTAEQRRDAVLRSLALAAGKPDLQILRLDGDLEKLPQIEIEESRKSVLQNNPALNYARKDIERSQAALAVARKMPVPDLQLRGGLQQNFEPLATGRGNIGLQGFAEIGVTLPLFNRNQGGIASAGAEVERAKQEVTREQLDLEARLTQLFVEYDVARLTVERYSRDLLPRAQQAFEMYRGKYFGNMAAAYPLVLMSQRTYFQLQVDYLKALEQAWRGAVAMQSFLAGQDTMMDMSGQ